MKRTLPGEIWRADFGIAAKVRPALIFSEFPADDELALVRGSTHDGGSRQSVGAKYSQAFLESMSVSSSADSTDGPSPNSNRTNDGEKLKVSKV